MTTRARALEPKPTSTGQIRPVVAQYPELWRGMQLCIPFTAGGERPLCWTAAPRTLSLLPHGTLAGLPTPRWGRPGRTFRSEGTAGFRIDDADLPAGFPAKVSTDYTALCYMMVSALPVDTFHNTLIKDSSGEGFFLYVGPSGYVGAQIGADEAASTDVVIVDEWALNGSRFSGGVLETIVRGRADGSAPGQTMATGSGALSIFSRADGVGNRSLQGEIAVVYVWDRALGDDELSVLREDPFAPLRARAARPARSGSMAASVWSLPQSRKRRQLLQLLAG